MILVYRVKETGQWCAPSIEDAAFDLTEAELDDRSHRVALALGLLPGALDTVIAEVDPRSGELIAEPAPPAPPAPEPGPTLDERIAAAVQKAIGKA